jgi:phosphoglycerate dehydrogenase-like enzyme
LIKETPWVIYYALVLALRRDSAKYDEGLADEVFSTNTSPEELLETFYKRCQFVISTLPGTPETRNIIGKSQFEAMPQSSVFINCGRGIVVDESSLVALLLHQQT